MSGPVYPGVSAATTRPRMAPIRAPFPSCEGRTLSRDVLRRILISASLYLLVAAAVMAAAFVLDRLEPDADGAVADLDADPGAEILTTSATPWTQAR